MPTSGEPLGHVGQRHDAVDLGVQLRDERLRRAARRLEAVPVVHREAGHAGFRDVGRSLNCSTRFAEVTASGRIRFAFMLASAVDTVAKINWMLPPTRSTMAGAPPLYGTCCIFTPASVLNSSPARWSANPTPEEP